MTAITNIIDSNKYGAINLDALEALEAEIGCKLPTEYGDFLISNNGGSPLFDCFEISKQDGDDRLSSFFGLHTGPEYLQLDKQLKVFKERIPDKLLPIADDAFGNLVGISLNDDSFGAIFFWDHEKQLNNSFSSLIKLSASLTEFISSLKEDISDDPIERILDKGSVLGVRLLLDSGYDIESEDENGRTLIEVASIKNKVEIIQYLHQRGAKLRTSLQLAKKNAMFFPEHKKSVDLLQSLMK
ncbi:SMI1/KNR4 family protein [Psychromonas aquimarina]|uniref:SMI1/KNR4 family protein n=1 Tax=Psychromonas aquimarina TaxID=444919 RepID=UPI00040E8011|nr:SMI1/KNR4 family protein [Psychromonas aquimarina]